jgi:hypothetical protein
MPGHNQGKGQRKLTEYFEREQRASQPAVPALVEEPEPLVPLLPRVAGVDEAGLAGMSLDVRREWAINWVESQQFPFDKKLVYLCYIDQRYAEIAGLPTPGTL